jgi:cell division protein FtsB
LPAEIKRTLWWVVALLAGAVLMSLWVASSTRYDWLIDRGNLWRRVDELKAENGQLKERVEDLEGQVKELERK